MKSKKEGTGSRSAPRAAPKAGKEWWIGFVYSDMPSSAVMMDKPPGDLSVHFGRVVHVREIETPKASAKPAGRSRTKGNPKPSTHKQSKTGRGK
jgi:hypothetical protein